MSEQPSVPPWRLALELAMTAAVGAAVIFLLGSVLIAFGTKIPAGDTTVRFQLLANAANPLTALLVLGGAVAAITLRRTEGTGLADGKLLGPVLAVAVGVALVLAILVVNGILVDLTSNRTSGLVRLGTLLVRIGTLVLAGATLWLGFAAGNAARASRSPVDIGTALTFERPPED